MLLKFFFLWLEILIGNGNWAKAHYLLEKRFISSFDSTRQNSQLMNPTQPEEDFGLSSTAAGSSPFILGCRNLDLK